jgi:hypothetical protein
MSGINNLYTELQIIKGYLNGSNGALNVVVVNPLDLSTIETTLNMILNSVQNIDINTDDVETLLGDIITALGNLDSDDDAVALAAILTELGNVVAALQALDTNTTNLENILNSILTQVTPNATEVKQDTQISLATTANAALNSILSSLNSSQDIEILLVRDVGDGNIVVQQIREYDIDSGSFLPPTYQKVDGSVHTVVGPLEYLDPSAVLNLILSELQGTLDVDVTANTIGLATDAKLEQIRLEIVNVETLLALINAKVATQTTLAALLTELQNKADLTETQPVSLAGSTVTPGLIRATDATGSPIAAGARAVSVYNAGSANGQVLGQVIKPGESMNWSAGGEANTLGPVAFDGTGTELVITTTV